MSTIARSTSHGQHAPPRVLCACICVCVSLWCVRLAYHNAKPCSCGAMRIRVNLATSHAVWLTSHCHHVVCPCTGQAMPMLGRRFQDLGGSGDEPSHVALSWMVCLFTTPFPPAATPHVWDVLFVQRSPKVCRVVHWVSCMCACVCVCVCVCVGDHAAPNVALCLVVVCCTFLLFCFVSHGLVVYLAYVHATWDLRFAWHDAACDCDAMRCPRRDMIFCFVFVLSRCCFKRVSGVCGQQCPNSTTAAVSGRPWAF